MCTAGDLASELCTGHARETARSAGSRLAGRAGGAVIRIVTPPTRAGLPSPISHSASTRSPSAHTPCRARKRPAYTATQETRPETNSPAGGGPMSAPPPADTVVRVAPMGGAADVGGLVTHDLVAAQRDRKAVAPGRCHPHGLH